MEREANAKHLISQSPSYKNSLYRLNGHEARLFARMYIQGTKNGYITFRQVAYQRNQSNKSSDNKRNDAMNVKHSKEK